jgi:hypothetical protein
MTRRRRRIEHSAATHHWCQPRALLVLPARRAFRADMRRDFPQLPAMWLSAGFSGRQGPQDGEPRAVLGVMLGGDDD